MFKFLVFTLLFSFSLIAGGFVKPEKKEISTLLSVQFTTNITSWSADEAERYFVASDDRSIKVVDLKHKTVIKNYSYGAKKVCLDANYLYILQYNSPYVIKLGLTTPESHRFFLSKKELIDDFFLSKDEVALIKGKKLSFFDKKKGTLINKQSLKNSVDSESSLLANEKFIVFSRGDTLHVYDLDKKAFTHRLITDDVIRYQRILDSTHLLTVDKGDISIWNLLTGEKIKHFKEDAIVDAEKIEGIFFSVELLDPKLPVLFKYEEGKKSAVESAKLPHYYQKSRIFKTFFALEQSDASVTLYGYEKDKIAQIPVITKPKKESSVVKKESNPSPKLAFVAASKNVCVKTEAKFLFKAFSEGEIVSYTIDFKDGEKSSQNGTFNQKKIHLYHTFKKKGIYDVTLEVTDDKGAKASKVRSINIVGEEFGCKDK